MISKYKSVVNKPEQLKIYDKYYKVTKISNHSFIEEIVITSEPFVSEHTKSLFINCSIIKDNEIHYSTDFSLLDYNVIPNTYNKHHIFSDYNEALKYSKE